ARDGKLISDDTLAESSPQRKLRLIPVPRSLLAVWWERFDDLFAHLKEAWYRLGEDFWMRREKKKVGIPSPA
ncbi:unnamed protein product, partial [Allacma fusca]